MTIAGLNHIIHQPGLIGESEVTALDQLIQKFPYCQTFHILKTKGMHNVQSLGYTEQLKLTAVAVADRKNLYEIIIQESLLNKIAEVEKEMEIPVQEKVVEVIETQPTLKTSVDEEQPSLLTTVDTEKRELVVEEKPIIEETVQQDEAQSSLKTSVDKVKEEVVSIEEKEENIAPIAINFSKALEESIPLNKPISTIEIPVKTEEKSGDEVIEKEVLDVKIASPKISNLEQEILYEAINKSIQNEVQEDIIEEKKELGYVEETKVVDEYSGPKNFMDWLHVNDKLKANNSPKTGVQPAKNLSTSSSPKQKTEDLIDKFIMAEPRITPSKAEFYSPTNMAKLSVVDTEEFVSETLAKIYEKQAYYDKAIRVYEKLSLKFPEKSSYFATLIEKIELQKAIDKQKKNK